MTKWVMRIVGGEMDGCYMKDYDVNAFDGRGTLSVCKNIAQARRFSTAAAAMEAWRMQSRIRPLRPDGLPNKPLTAYTVEIQKVDD